jgi:hypothetical protein
MLLTLSKEKSTYFRDETFLAIGSYSLTHSLSPGILGKKRRERQRIERLVVIYGLKSRQTALLLPRYK